MKPLERFDWKKLQTGTLSVRPTPEMLQGIPYVRRVSARIKGEMRGQGDPPVREFVYGEDYVREWLKQNIINGLFGGKLDASKLLELLEEEKTPSTEGNQNSL